MFRQSKITPVRSIPAVAVTLMVGVSFACASPVGLLVSVDWLSEHLGDPGLVVLHVGSSEETYQEGHIPGALFARWDDFVVTRDGVPNELPDRDTLIEWVQSFGVTEDSRIVLYDESTGMSAARAFFTLDSLGLGDRVSVLDGQLAAWKAEGNELSSQTPEATPSDWIPEQGDPRKVITREEVADLLATAEEGSGPKFLDSRSHEYFTGEKKSGVAMRGGHLPGAIQFDWSEAVQEGDIPLLKPSGDLSHLLEEKGVKKEDPVITYCNTGRSASHLYFTLRHLGYDVRMYDGSMSEWTLDDKNPVEVGDGE